LETQTGKEGNEKQNIAHYECHRVNRVVSAFGLLQVPIQHDKAVKTMNWRQFLNYLATSLDYLWVIVVLDEDDKRQKEPVVRQSLEDEERANMLRCEFVCSDEHADDSVEN
jgi:hypothetical protein